MISCVLVGVTVEVLVGSGVFVGVLVGVGVLVNSIQTPPEQLPTKTAYAVMSIIESGNAHIVVEVSAEVTKISSYCNVMQLI